MSYLVLLPLLASLVVVLRPAAGRWVGMATAGLLLVPLFLLTRQVVQQGPMLVAIGGWGAPLGIAWRLDSAGILMLWMTAIISPVVGMYAAQYFEEKKHFFWPLWMFLWTALNALFCAADIFNLYVTLELLSLSAVAMVALAGTRVAYQAAMRYLMVGLGGSLLFLMGVALVYSQASMLDWFLLSKVLQPGLSSNVALVLMSVGLLMKTALFPLHFWLPSAHANAPAPVSALLSALVVKGSFYILARLWFYSFSSVVVVEAQWVLGFLGAGAIFWGSLQALRQSRLKLLVAYSTVAQLGYLFLLFPLKGAWAGAFYFALSHACAKTVMFLCAGNLMKAAGHDRLDELGPAAQAMPMTMFAFALASISLVGLPPSGGFIAKWLFLSAAIAQGQWGWVVVMAGGTLLSAAYVMRLLRHAFFKLEYPRALSCSSVPALMQWPVMLLALFCIVLGFVASPCIEFLNSERFP
jgi:multicomponent Na+:H+ antiporter subunit D